MKEAEFPQPELEFGQIWYVPTYARGIVSGYFPKAVASLNQVKKFRKLSLDCFFAPTATDILRELEGEYFLDFDTETEEFFALKSVGAAFKFSNKEGCEALADAYFRMVENDGIE